MAIPFRASGWRADEARDFGAPEGAPTVGVLRPSGGGTLFRPDSGRLGPELPVRRVYQGPMSPRLRALPLLLRVSTALALLPCPLISQASEGDRDWNDPRALELVAAARDVRQSSAVDSTLRSYRARAQGFVYFFLDRADEEEHTLIKADQIALDVFWRSPDQTRQRIVGMRDEEVLPTNIRYHLDHLTVVQDDFQDLIRMGDGDEVGAVLHPAAPRSETVYDFRLADSLSLNYGGLDEPVRVYEVQVRPKDTERPGFVGALYLDRANGAIVRMAFTFTPASYVDPYLAYIRISLDNALWMGRHWLPYRQEVELRRELPQLDFMAGSIIRGRWEVGDYQFNQPVPDFFFSGPRVTAAPERLREEFPFPDELYADLDQAGLAPSPSLEEIEDQVRSMALAGAVQGLSPLRLYLSSVSDAVRRNRVEGWSVGGGVTVRPGERPLRLLAGYATAAERPWARAVLDVPTEFGSVQLEGHWNQLRDLGPITGASGLVNTLATLGGSDYLDPFWSHGGAASVTYRLGPTSRVEARGLWQEHGAAELGVDGDNTVFRPVLPVTEGTLGAVEAALIRSDDGDGLFGSARVRVGHLGDTYARTTVELGWSRLGPSIELERSVSLLGGWTTVSGPLQELYLLGGRGTVPGYEYRTSVGDRYVLARGWVRHPVVAPWIAFRLTAASSWARYPDRTLPPEWGSDGNPEFRASVGVGVDLLWNVLRFDVARGVSEGGGWEFFFSVSPQFTPWL